MNVATRETVVEIFERHRQAPGAAFDDSHFLDYLLTRPKGPRSIHNSFRGLRRYNAFVDEVQECFCVYLSLKDFEADWSLDRFVQRIREIQASQRSSLASFRSHMRTGFGWNTVAILSLIGLAVALALWPHWRDATAAVLLAVTAGNVWALKSYLRWQSYHQRLARALEAASKDLRKQSKQHRPS